jgi:hypothetical protein
MKHQHSFYKEVRSFKYRISRELGLALRGSNKDDEIRNFGRKRRGD